MRNSGIISTASIPIDSIAATEFYQKIARDPRAFLPFFVTLPGPDDDFTGPRNCALWEGVADLLGALLAHERVIGLKSRKIGFTTSGLSTALWTSVAFPFSRAHLFSYRDDAAKDLIRRLRFAWRRLPDALRLPLVEDNDHTLSFNGGRFSGEADDVRTIKAYPTTEEASADETADFVMIDEAARIDRLHGLYAAVEPTVRRFLMIVSSGRGPDGDFVEMWQAARSGTLRLAPRFYPWTSAPGRDESWRKTKLESYAIREIAKREYPETEDDAFLGLEEYVFATWALERARDGAVGLSSPKQGRNYWTAWDIGKERDAAVGVVLDITERPYQVVGFERALGLPYPALQAKIEDLWRSFGGELFVEKNGPGAVVADNLAVPVTAVTTSPKSKSEMISKLVVYLENGWLKFTGIPQLERELRGYKWDDKAIVQDSVMALAIALYNAPSGDILGIG